MGEVKEGEGCVESMRKRRFKPFPFLVAFFRYLSVAIDRKVRISAFFAIRQKTLAKKRIRALPLTRCAPDGFLRSVGVVRLRVSYAKETWVSLAGGFWV